jgi:hypothetical protein
LLIKN